jgi:hypothetical protein
VRSTIDARDDGSSTLSLMAVSLSLSQTVAGFQLRPRCEPKLASFFVSFCAFLWRFIFTPGNQETLDAAI